MAKKRWMLKIGGHLGLELPDDSVIYADKAYNCYRFEDLLSDKCNIRLVPKRKKDSRRKNTLCDEFNLSIYRNRVESAFSSIASITPRYLRASTEKGFCLKIFFIILAYTVKKIINV